MRKISILYLICFLSNTTIFAQPVLFEKEIELKKGFFKNYEDSYSAINYNDGSYVIFILENDSLNKFGFTKQHELIKQNTIIRPESKYETLIGHCRNANNHSLFFFDSNSREICIQTSGWNRDIVKTELFNFDNKDEYFLEAFSKDSNIYILTIQKFTSLVRVYKFNEGNYTKNQVCNFSEYEFYHNDFNKLFDVLNRSPRPFKFELVIKKIDNTIPNPLENTSKKNKIYCDSNFIILTLDNSQKKTELIQISLVNGEFSVIEFPKPVLNRGELYEKSNSFYSNNKLYQLISAKKQLLVQIIDISTEKILKSYEANSINDISFRNSGLMEEGHNPNNLFNEYWDKEIDNSKKVLKKIFNSNVGLSIYELNNSIQLTIGGYEEKKQSSGSPIYTTSGTSGTIVTQPTYGYNSNPYVVNPTLNGFHYYTNTKSIYFKSILNKTTLNHVAGSISKNVFDKIRDFKISLSGSTEDLMNDSSEKLYSEVIFKHDGKYIYGYYRKKSKKYYLREFKE